MMAKTPSGELSCMRQVLFIISVAPNNNRRLPSLWLTKDHIITRLSTSTNTQKVNTELQVITFCENSKYCSKVSGQKVRPRGAP